MRYAITDISAGAAFGFDPMWHARRDGRMVLSEKEVSCSDRLAGSYADRVKALGAEDVSLAEAKAFINGNKTII